MNRSMRPWVSGAVAATALVVSAGLAWACVGLMALTTTSSSVQPGGKVTVLGKEFAQDAPIQIHLDSATGPVLATVPPLTDTMTSQFRVDVSIPSNVPNGQHVLVATEDYHYMNSGAPARATIYVGSPPPAPNGPAARPANVRFSKGPSGASLVQIGVAVAALGLLLAGALSRAGSRRRAEPEPARAT